MDRGITVISWDSGVAPEGRQMHLNPSSTALIGNTIIKLAADHLPEGGEVAVLSATSTSTNQNTWIEEMNKVMRQLSQHQRRRAPSMATTSPTSPTARRRA